MEWSTPRLGREGTAGWHQQDFRMYCADTKKALSRLAPSVDDVNRLFDKMSGLKK